MNDENNATKENHQYPSIVGAATVTGLLVGTAIAGSIGDFAVWLPICAAAGVILGLLVGQKSDRNNH